MGCGCAGCGLRLAVELAAAGEDDVGGLEQGAVPAGAGGLELEMAFGGEGLAGERGEVGVVTGEVDGNVADNFAGVFACLVVVDEPVGGGGLEDEELLLARCRSARRPVTVAESPSARGTETVVPLAGPPTVPPWARVARGVSRRASARAEPRKGMWV